MNGNFKFKNGRLSRDGYQPLSVICNDCGKKVARISCGNGAGVRWGMAMFIRPAMDEHDKTCKGKCKAA